MLISRRGLMMSAAALAACPAFAQQARFSFASVMSRAEAISRMPFDDRSDPEPGELAALDYDGYRKIRFRPESRIKLGAGFELDLFHRGHIFPRRVGVNILRDGQAAPLPYTPGAFDFGGQNIGPFAADIGFAGLRLRYPLNRPDVADELMVFLGASYFRFLSRGQRYGLSARGLAINAGIPGETEEFPFFREFWIEEAKPEQTTLQLYALLDSPSVAGAFSFQVSPGQNTATEVSAVLFPRKNIERIGIAPLTSMYFTGGSGPRHADMFRREVHDSDGLLMRRDGAAVWRPLRNPRESRASSFAANSVQGFGLMQRNRQFDDYQDLEAHYEMRPSYFVEPLDEWGPGSVELSELATESETNDNIVASYRPQGVLAAGERTQWRYRMIATGAGAKLSPLARVHKTLLSERAAIQYGKPKGSRLYLVDFTGGDLDYFRTALDEIEIALQSTTGAVSAEGLTWNPHTRAVRARIFAQVEIGQSTDVSATLLHRGKPLSETWLAHWFRHPEREQELASGLGVR
ncbi:MAG: opgD [Hyphomicrobiales bacterium]|jgi:glucans biosynthesis protein|nr:opgD [Hyphomicrobiales bacterium]